MAKINVAPPSQSASGGGKSHLVLGPFVFLGTEIPGHVPFGIEQMLSVKNQAGGGRVIDAMGPINDPIAWNGIFYGSNAMVRARQLNALLLAAQPLTVRWSSLVFQVMIHRFKPVMKYENEVHYSIRLIPTTASWFNAPPVKYTTQAAVLKTNVNAVAANPQSWWTTVLSTAISGLQTAVATVSHIAGLANQAVQAILQPIQQAQAELLRLKASVENALLNITTLGGVLPNNPVASMVSSVLNQANLAIQDYEIDNLSATIIGSNQAFFLGGLPALIPLVTPSMITGATPQATQTQITVGAGTRLDRLALQYYGDATQWTVIANANGLSSPVVPAQMAIVIPAWSPSDTGVFEGPFLNATLNALGTLSEGSGLTPETGLSALPVDLTWTLCA